MRTASKELQDAFNSLLSSSSHRGLVAVVASTSESIVPRHTVVSSASALAADLSNLEPLLTENEAAYIILKQDAAEASESNAKCIAVTYVPEQAPVRQKMLFASTRLTLVRELGMEQL